MIWEVSTSTRFVLSFWVVLENFLKKCTSLSLSYPIRAVNFSDNIQYQIREPLKVLLTANKENQLPEGVFTDRELNASIGRKLITTPLNVNDNIVKKDKLACITEMVISLDELENTVNLEDGRLSNVILRYYVIGSEEFMSFGQVTPQYKRIKNGKFAFLTLRITEQEDNSITDSLGIIIVLYTR